MSIEKIRAQVTGSIWQAIAQSGIDLSAISQEDQEKLVGKIATGVMVSINAVLDEEIASQKPQTPKKSPENTTIDEEMVLWEGRPFLSLVENYVLTTDRLKIIKGLVGRDVENFELIRVQDIDYSQAAGERMIGIGDITIRGQDKSDSIIVLRNISKPEEVYEIMRKAWLEARKRHGLQFREYM